MADHSLQQRFTVRELIDEATREVEMRRRVYPKQVIAGRITQGESERRIAMMESIADRLLRASLRGFA